MNIDLYRDQGAADWAGFWKAYRACRVIAAHTVLPDFTVTKDVIVRNPVGKVTALPIDLKPGESVHLECKGRHPTAPLCVLVEYL